ncbi:MAG: hypothetical protein ACI8P7_000891 [Candidatus Azotimanducaceae bacterium]|jgi:hypothetical protein
MKLKSILPHVGVVAIFFAVVLIYFFPVFEGKRINQSDSVNGAGVTKEIVDFRKANNGEEPLWTNSMFAGQPTFFVSTIYPYDLGGWITNTLSIGIPKPISSVFISFICFYFLLLVFRVDWRIAAIGALAYGLSTYMFLLLEAGHNNKTYAMAYMPGLLGAIVLTLRDKLWLGAFLTAMFTAVEIRTNHPQVTYYLLLILLVFFINEFVQAVKNKGLPVFAKKIIILLFAAFLGVAPNLSRLWTNYEYSKYTIRGKSELSAKIKSGENGGVSLDYATAWSSGKAETFTALVPNFHGGASSTALSKDSELAKKIGRAPNAKQILKNVPTYFGEMPFTSGPIYFGAIVIFLFVLGLFVVEKRMLWWLIPATILSILLSWGRHFMWFTEFFYNYVPMYNKFRTVSMTLVMAEMLMPLLGFYGLHKLFQLNKEDALKTMKKASITIASLLGLLFMASLMMDYSGANDASLASKGWPVDAILKDREAMVKADIFRSLIFIALAGGAIWMILKSKLKSSYGLLIIGALVLIDLVGVNHRYLNADDYVNKSRFTQAFKPTQADLQIMQDPDPHYRVFNQAERLDAGARTCYFHKSLGGYSAVKMGRYQELIDAHISKGNPAVINMLNTKYVLRDNGGELQAVKNPGTLGNAWFVKEVKEVANADAEIAALGNFDPNTTAIVDKRFMEGLETNYSGVGSVTLNSYSPKELKYTYNTPAEQLIVLSEIYYDKGWVARVDGNEVEIKRANYVLRTIEVPAGKHDLVLSFKPTSYHLGSTIGLIAVILLIGFGAGVVYLEIKNSRSKA